MPAWIHDRAQHLLAKNPSMSKGQAFAIATQQSHSLGKSPKNYGTSEGRAQAKQKYDKPRKQYKKTPNPGGLETPKLESREKKAMYHSAAAELLKIAADVLSGGKADDKPASSFSPRQIAMGKKVEMEHTNSPELATEISRDHLEEFPDYYTRLKKMESEAEAAKEKTSCWRFASEALAKLADGDGDEDEDDEGAHSGRAPTAEDKAAIKRFLASTPKGTEDEEFHEFLTSRGIKVPLGEAAVYDMARESVKTAQGFSISYDLDGNRQDIEWHKDALARILSVPLESGPLNKTSGAQALTPAGRLAASMQVGRPKLTTPPGPSIAQIGKIKGPGSGTAMPGAKAGGAV